MRKPLFLIYLLLMAFTMAAVGQVAQAPDRQNKYDEEYKQRQRDYYQAYLKGCKTNEIRTVWFLDHERVGMEAATIHPQWTKNIDLIPWQTATFPPPCSS